MRKNPFSIGFGLFYCPLSDLVCFIFLLVEKGRVRKGRNMHASFQNVGQLRLVQLVVVS